MKTLLVLALLSFTPADNGAVTRMAGVIAVSPKGELTLDRQEKVKLAGVAISNWAAVQQFLKQFLVNKVAKFDFEPGSTSAAHVFVAIDCKEIATVLKEPMPQSDGSCVRSVYVNELLLKKRWAKPAPKGTTLYREKLFPAPAAKPARRARKN